MATIDDQQDLFASIAALTIHDVKNNLTQLANDAEARVDLASLKVVLRASEALTGLLCFYRSETHHLDVQIDAHDPCDMLSDLISNLPRSLREQPGIAIELNIKEAPSIGFYDRTLIQMVMANALQNALRFAHSQIEIGVIAHPDKLEFYVKDDGMGYPFPSLKTKMLAVPSLAAAQDLDYVWHNGC
jgi:signal transduction histidine kinase